MGQAGLFRERPLATHRGLPPPLLLALNLLPFRLSGKNRIGEEAGGATGRGPGIVLISPLVAVPCGVLVAGMCPTLQ